MAGEKCSLTCNVRDAHGNVKVSALWEDLSKFFKQDRRQAVVHYFLTKDSNFLRENSDILEFDVDGEVTIASLKKAIERDGEYSDLSNALTLEHLNREIKAGKYDYSEALDNVLKFNRSDQFRDGFMATLKRQEDGKYEVKVVERNPETEYELAEHVQNKILTDAIRLVLKDKGLSVEFLDNPNYAVQYNTNNLHLDADGLYAVASVLHGVNTSAEVAEAAGHFIAASMQDSPLMQRLADALTPEVQERIFRGKDAEFQRDDFIVAESSAREAAGILIGKALLRPVKESQKSWTAKLGQALPKGIKWLIDKVINFFKKIMGTYEPDDVAKMVQRAKEMASTAAQGFIANPNEANVMQALNTPDTFTAGNISKRMAEDVRKNVRAFHDTLGSLKDTISRLRTSVYRAESPVNKDIYKKLKTLVKGISANYSSQMNLEVFAKKASIEGIVVALEGITQVLDTDVRTLLDQIQPADRANAYTSTSTNARNLRTVNTAIKNIATLYQVISTRLDSLNAEEAVTFPDADDNMVTETLREAVERLGEVLIGREEVYTDTKGEQNIVRGLQGLLEAKRRQLFIDAFRDFYGQDFINRAAGMVWQQRGIGFKLVKSGNYKVEIADLIDYLEEDISWFDRYFASAADCGDFVTAIGNKVTKAANMQADRLASKFWDRIEELRLQMQDAFGTTDWNPLLEVAEDEEGRTVKTGNFVTRVNYGAWEKDRAEFKKQLRKDWNEYLADFRKKAYESNAGVKGYVFSLTDQQRAVLYHSFIDPLWQKWHEEHSEVEKTAFGKRWVPNSIKYHSIQWDNLFDLKNPTLSEEEKALRAKRLRWYNSFMELKENMDALLPPNATITQRAPQMTGRFSHRYRNLRAKMENSRAAFGHAMRKSAQDWWTIRPDEAWMFGSNNEFNEMNEDPLGNEMFFQKEKVNRLPIFGVNKLHDMDDLSTDIFGTMLQYGSMAATYNAMERVVDVFELGRDVLKQRKVRNKGNKSEMNLDEGQSKAYSRYLKFIEKQVYGINVTPPNWDKRNMWRKLANNLSSLGGRILLYGNVHGGIVNTGTGMFEIFKEAVSGENFSMADVHEAHKMYFNGVLSTDEGSVWATMGNDLIHAQRPEDKNSLWIRHWNILSENRSFLHNQRFDNKALSVLDNRLYEWFGHTMMLPYSSGDHYMQTIPYYAMGNHVKVYDHSGKAMRLIDAYEIVDGEEVFAVGSEDGEASIGRTPKKLKLKENIFRSAADIKKYDTAQSMLETIDNFFLNNPSAKNNHPIALDLFTDEAKTYLEEEGLSVPENVKQLNTLKTALQLKAGELRYNETDESAFMDKCRNICNRLHGIYNSEDKVCFQQNFYGSLVMALRGYALGMINRRYASSSFNVPQGRVVEGSYNTALKVLASAFYNINNADNWKAVGEAMLLMLPLGNLALFSNSYGNRLKADMIKAGFSENQYYNMRRTSADFLVLEALAVMNMLTAPGQHFGLGDEDEDKNNKVDTSDNFVAGLVYYFTMRWFNEQGAFTWPTAMWNEGTSLLDYIPAGLSGAKAIWDIAWLFAQTQYDQLGGHPDLNNSDLYYQSSKEGKYEMHEPKWHKRFKSLCPYVRSWYAMSHPYDAASSYEYGRRVRGK